MTLLSFRLENYVKKMTFIVFFLSFIISISGCRTVIKTLDADIKPLPTSFPIKAPKGPEIYKQGWIHGCHSGLASTNEMVRPEFRYYSHKLDRNLQHNKTYWRVWNDAYNYCAFTMLTIMKNHS